MKKDHKINLNMVSKFIKAERKFKTPGLVDPFIKVKRFDDRAVVVTVCGKLISRFINDKNY